MARKGDSESAADLAYTMICERILSGDLKPGQRLTRKDMAELTGVSIIPVIDALHRLESEGLVQSLPYVGSSVISLTAETKRDRYALRLAAESQIARMIARGRLREDVKYRLIEQAKTIDTQLQINGMAKTTWEMHFDFHAGFARLTDCPSLVDAMRRDHLFMLLEWQELSHWQQANDHPDTDALSHVWLLGEIFSGDPGRSEMAARRHIAAAATIPKDLIDWNEGSES
ncbi:MAG: GntR family transcriptional regulator [Treponemataceae bacterium]